MYETARLYGLSFQRIITR